MRARTADAEGFIEHHGVKIHYEVHGAGGPTILLLPTWTIVHNRFWKGQLAYLARHHRVVTYDGPGNGLSDRPVTPEPYGQAAQIAYALAVLDATGTEQAVVAGLSRAANWALELAAEHPARVLGTIVLAPSVARGKAETLALDAPAPALDASAVRAGGADPPAHWAKYNRRYWLKDYEDFLWFFFGQCFTEPHSTKAIEDGVAWGLDTSPDVLVAESQAARPSRETIESWCTRITTPLLAVHGDQDRVVPVEVSEKIVAWSGGELVLLEGGGHIPPARDPVRVNLLISEFVARLRPPAPRRRTWSRWNRRQKRVLYLSSPIGLGHARRDLAIARELRALHPDVRIDWLTQHPVTRMLDEAGEHVHPASRWLASESAHIESEADEHDLHCFQALRRADEILVSNFMVFHDLVTEERYDLVIGDESWDVDHFLHENPELKRFAYAWMTDFVGFLPFPDGGDREALVAADHNAEMIAHVERFPRVRDRAVFIGDPGDIVDERFGRDLPPIREWTEAHYDFAGYVTGFDPGEYADREALRAELGYHRDERVCVVTVGGSGVGKSLLHRVVAAFPEAAMRVPGLRMVVVAGPRIDPGTLPRQAGLEVHAYVPGLHRHLAACDLAIVQGGLTTCMELTATRRPFIYVPLRHHFEQNFHVAHRLRRHGAGRRMDFDEITPGSLAEAIAAEIGREVAYRPVPPDGAARAASMLAGLL
ncbi:alpha/beta fold hydrolase [Nonomuraea sp. NN258]|uniref:alpha/beta hydrolase n=1 Tax=Nonomuraea antri TaxID=2730852 RepID=UPI001567D71C|nr:alpha/beta fold hydrolase [Nonomuraea antri]NRQ32400.1 alpha/beta fold hydrolase [Nonomuraea antri]